MQHSTYLKTNGWSCLKLTWIMYSSLAYLYCLNRVVCMFNLYYMYSRLVPAMIFWLPALTTGRLVFHLSLPTLWESCLSRIHFGPHPCNLATDTVCRLLDTNLYTPFKDVPYWGIRRGVFCPAKAQSFRKKNTVRKIMK